MTLAFAESMKEIKAKFISHLQNLLQERADDIQLGISSAKESRDGETKSSVGDKYETGRAMAQIEIQKLEEQLAKNQQMRRELSQISESKMLVRAEQGAWIQTNEGVYFLSIGLGRVQMDNQTILVVSPMSPIGKAIMGKRAGEEAEFQGRKIQILSIS